MDHLPHNSYSVRNDTPTDEFDRIIWNGSLLDEKPTSFKDPNPPVPTGAQPVLQTESRIVPQLATGTAVVGIGVGTMAVGIGAGANLAGAGADMFFSSITPEGVAALGVIAAAPFVLAAGVGIVISKLKAAATEAKEETHNYYGTTTVDSRTEIHQTARGLARNISHKR